MALDATGSAAAIAALAAAAGWESVSIYLLSGDPVPLYADMSQPTQVLLDDWRRMFTPAMNLQARLCVLAGAASGVAAFGLRGENQTAAAAFGVAAACNAGIFWYTLAKIMPVNRRLLTPGQAEKAEGEPGVRSLLKQWGEMHGVRTAFGAVALAAAAYGTHALLTRS
ncbi:hypothetical protein C2E20_1404 [Micractinium conductrix]|uniref:Uncharacterized protein n=1 Tax=Micractinium conductrix TaxID=554055 RepID=A0A2P6VNW8_9CHLO|nr:hypothetical protein C2E20_1404 [Micractinium conductrix]|eukprot:PSC75770.1 hypothetical protein C2E20_1404 [Micractinium conductrix]